MDDFEYLCILRVALPIERAPDGTLSLLPGPGCILAPDETAPDVAESGMTRRPVGWAIYWYHSRCHTVGFLNVTSVEGGPCQLPWNSVWPAVCMPPHDLVREFCRSYLHNTAHAGSPPPDTAKEQDHV